MHSKRRKRGYWNTEQVILELKNFYWDDESLLSEMKNLIDQIGKFPSLAWLAKNKRYDLTNAIKRNGGISKFRKILKCPHEPKKKYWNEGKVREELKSISEQLNGFPLYSQIPKRLKHQIAKYGGINFFRININS